MDYKSVFLTTNGCPENRNDLARMQTFMEKQNWKPTKYIYNADLVLFNSCGLTCKQEQNSIDIINELKKNKKSSTELIVCGCLPKINKERFESAYQGSTIESNDNKDLADYLGVKDSGSNSYANNLHESAKWYKIKKLFKMKLTFKDLEYKIMNLYQSRYTAIINVYRSYSYIIKISSGCLSSCSFCAVRLSRGLVNSKLKTQVMKEFDEGLAKGYSEFSLIGTDIGSYGRDRKTNLVDLLREIIKRKENYKIRLRNIQPKFLIKMLPELIEIIKTEKISYMSIAAESGNNRILKLMNRGYTIEEYKKVVHAIKDAYPNIELRTQLMVGFPGETDSEFEDTLHLLDELSFDITEVYMYSPRPNTKAANMMNPVPKSVAKKRYAKLLRKSIFNQLSRKRQAIKNHETNLKLLSPVITA